MQTVAELTDVIKRYGRVVALDRLKSVDPVRRVSSLLGANGQGKTTAVRVVVRPHNTRVRDRYAVRRRCSFPQGAGQMRRHAASCEGARHP